ncbi:MAG: hypothetical protein C6P37_04365 [Caldibacillus debilis]|jgi:hypothetical protein|uniref:Uncharacterized protein n=1 Tax=Caldibacillus debilis TaxID=301148 RepID=A0A3E0K7H0_9BACI|nr:hypothetical protein [Bacillaceae bacterium]OUM90452.1 MAG: hypothetical protein BAA03_08210 [Caldibacillus debilis]REJ14818.1 MAG: hypothetical protein C6W57_12915 [Caldibacillus debilis]REJ22556.1 MAG: hypothetical protein C6W56_16115 [Caldibacillus debilis]REJ30026.1 MAG: hypothetical protein C6P37_04365 [Caldibacillus debilis]
MKKIIAFKKRKPVEAKRKDGACSGRDFTSFRRLSGKRGASSQTAFVVRRAKRYPKPQQNEADPIGIS